jgi:hypothetical protein
MPVLFLCSRMVFEGHHPEDPAFFSRAGAALSESKGILRATSLSRYSLFAFGFAGSA